MRSIAVIGAGHLGKIHLRLLKVSPTWQLSGFYDIDHQRMQDIAAELDVVSFSSLEEALAKSDAVSIVTPTPAHYTLAKAALLAGKHVFVEKPVTHTLEEAEELIALSDERGLCVQVGHIERFNPAFRAAQQYGLQPLFVEGHRLAEFKPRGLDVSVVLDLMIHDLDLVLTMVGMEPIEVSASGVAVAGRELDIANARLAFANGCVANLTASRISLKNERKLRIFQQHAYVSVDMQKRALSVFRLEELADDVVVGEDEPVLHAGPDFPRKRLHYEIPTLDEGNPLSEELEAFGEAIDMGKSPVVTLQDGYRALKVAYRILSEIHIVERRAGLR